MLSIAVIGAGRIGQNPRTQHRGRMPGRVSPAWPMWMRRLPHAWPAQCGAGALSLDAAFAADAVLIGSPTPTHADYIERAAAAGRAIFCEKPIDLSAPTGPRLPGRGADAPASC